MMDYQQVVSFWFEELTPSQWWQKSEVVDTLISQRFADTHQKAVAGEAWEWRRHAAGRLAEIIVLDQFSRNIYRERAEAFQYDGMAIILAQEAVACGADKQLPINQRLFFYMPFMHSESLVIHQYAEPLFRQPGLEDNYQFELAHRRIIERFGRYPHRNAALQRTTSEEERLFLQEPGSSF